MDTKLFMCLKFDVKVGVVVKNLKIRAGRLLFFSWV